jgi:hypothetical protein
MRIYHKMKRRTICWRGEIIVIMKKILKNYLLERGNNSNNEKNLKRTKRALDIRNSGAPIV